MGWRDVLMGVHRAMTGERVSVLMGETREQRDARHAEAGMRYLQSRPAPDRIALARELLPAGFVVAESVPNMADVVADAAPFAAGYVDGWNACRAAMMRDDNGDAA
jgi:hypothetical protein